MLNIVGGTQETLRRRLIRLASREDRMLVIVPEQYTLQTEQELMDRVKACFDGKSFVNHELYLQRCAKFFPNHDNHNCERIYNSIIEIEKNG